MATPTTDILSASTAPNLSTTTSTLQAPQVLSTCHAAQVLFGQPLYSHYLGWQSSILGYGGAQFPGPEPVRVKLYNDRRSDTLGDFPSLLHYKHFMAYMVQVFPLFVFSEYLEKEPYQANGQYPETPFICGHRPHPGNEVRLTFLCSRCLIRHNNDTLERIVASYELMLHSRENSTDFRDMNFNLFNMIWSDQKTHWRDVVYDLEIEAKIEAKWESERQDEGLDVAQAIAGTVRSSEVLKEAFTNCPLMLEGWDFEFRPKPRKAPSSCRYKSILRRDASRIDQQNPCAIAKLCAGNRCARPNTRKDEAVDNSSRSRSFCGSSAEESVDRSTSPDTEAPPSPRTSLLSPNIIRKRFRWAEDVVQNTNRRRDCYQRRSILYQPGRWACHRKHGWAHPYGSEEDDEDSVTSDGSDGPEDVYAPNASRETLYPSSGHAGFTDLSAEAHGSQGPATVQRTVFDTNPLAEYDRNSTKRRRLDCRLPDSLPKRARFDPLEPNWVQVEAEGEARFHRMFGYDNTRDLSLKGSPSLAAYNEAMTKRRRLNNGPLDFTSDAALELSDMQKGAWDGAIQPHDRPELKEYAQSLAGGYLAEE